MSVPFLADSAPIATPVFALDGSPAAVLFLVLLKSLATCQRKCPICRDQSTPIARVTLESDVDVATDDDGRGPSTGAN